MTSKTNARTVFHGENRLVRPLGATALLLGLCLTAFTGAAEAGIGILPNPGHLDEGVEFYLANSRADVFFTAEGVVIDLRDPDNAGKLRALAEDPDLPMPTVKGQALFLTFPGGAAAPEIVAKGQRPDRASFFMGNDPDLWRSQVASYDAVTYRNMWPGIDVVFRLGQTGLEYELIVAKGADASQAEFLWRGADDIQPTALGSELRTAYGTLLVTDPAADKSGASVGSINLFAAGAPVDKANINALLWSTLFGGSADDVGTTLAIASNGDVIVAGETQSPNFPTTPGAYAEPVFNSVDIFVSRFANEGADLVWSTYLGTSTIEYCNAITLDAFDNPTVGGRTYAGNYPVTLGAVQTTAAGGQDAVVTKLSADGSAILASTYLGGSQVDSVFDLQTDAGGNLVIAGYTASSDYPTTVGCYQNYFAGPPYDYTITTLNADFTVMVASTYMGGTDRDSSRGLAIDGNGDLILAGFSFSTDFPVTAGTFQTVKSGIDDATLFKMAPDLSTLIWSTFIGGGASERSFALDLDAAGDPIITGYTASGDFPVTAGSFQEFHNGSQDAFVAKFNNADGTLQWSSFLGGSGGEQGLSLMVDDSGNPLVTGYTSSSNFPVNAEGFDETHNGSNDVFVTRLLADGTDILWSSFLGGMGNDSALELALDANDNPIVTGQTSSADFPVSTWAYDTTHNGTFDAFLTRFDTGEARLELVSAQPVVACGLTTTVAAHFVPDVPHTPPLRGYSIRVVAPAGVSFGDTNITVLSPLMGVGDTYEIIENAPGDYTVDFSFLDAGAGLTVPADLFTIEVTADSAGVSVMDIPEALFRDEDNHPFDADYSSTLELTIDCSAPDTPTMVAEPTYSAGTVNTVAWSDESGTGAATYSAQASLLPDFSVLHAESGFVPGLSYEFTGLADTTTYYFRVMARGANTLTSDWSAAVSSFQDAQVPVSSVDALPAFSGVNLMVPYTASDVGSGLAEVELFFNVDGGDWTSFGAFTTSPIAFTAAAGDGLYGFYTTALDSAGNLEAAPLIPDATVTVDTQGPVGSFAINGGAAATADSVVTLDMAMTDAVDMRFSNDNLVFPAGWVTYSVSQPWLIEAVEGERVVFAEFRDNVGNVLAVRDTISYDLTGPGQATFLVADAGHEVVSLTWNNPEDADRVGVEIWRARLHDGAYATAYPQYLGAVIPTAPVLRDSALVSPEWQLAGTVDGVTEAFADSVSERGVYYYEVFVIDGAGNAGAPTGLMPRATNYLLGDIYVPFNGDVDVADITTLGTTYGLPDGHQDFNADADVGPTHNNAGDGIPQPDDIIDFQDLMISALNFDLPAKGRTGAKATDVPVSLAWRQLGADTWALSLTVPHESFKGLEIVGDLPTGTVPQVTAGDLLALQDGPVFLRNIDENGLETGLALLGDGASFTGQGQLLRIQLPAGAADAFNPEDLTLTLRDVNNEDLTFLYDTVSAVNLPTVFSLEGNYPNPFNPSTTISFSLPTASDVRLEVFSVDGARVAVLVNETLQAGHHQTVWTGRDDAGQAVATGLYFYRVTAGSFSQVEKMTLLK